MAVVWLRNCRTLRTPKVRSTVAFPADPQIHLAVAVLPRFEFAALAFLTYVTMK